jgi:hypothetical protein
MGAAAALALLTVVPLTAQSARQVLITQSERSAKSRMPFLSAAAQVVPLTVDMNTFRSVAGPELRLASVPVAPGMSVDLDLEEFNIITPDAKITATGDHGPVPLTLTARLYKGKIAGDDASSAFLAFSKSSVSGTVVLKGKTYEISTNWDAHPSNGTVEAFSYPLADVQAGAGHCAVDAHNLEALGYTGEIRNATEKMMEKMAGEKSTLGTTPITIDYSMKGAFDGDYEFYQLFNNDAVAAADYMLEVIGRVGVIYDRDLGLQIRVGFMNIWTTAQDPYDVAPPSSMELALYEERDYWNGEQDDVDRAFTNVFSGKPWQGTIGIAFVTQLCNTQLAYGFCAMTRNNPAQDLTVTAHENGHILGSVHTHSCSWNPEIDRCAAAEEGSCFSQAQIKDTIGTIMSYCHQQTYTFHPKCAAVIKNNLRTRFSCVETSRYLALKQNVVYFKPTDINKPIDTTITDFFRNPSRSDVQITNLELSGAFSDQFELVDPKEGFTLPSGETRDLRVKYLAKTTDYAKVTLTVTHDGYNTQKLKLGLEAYSNDKQPSLGMVSGDNGINFKTIKVGQRTDTAFPNFYQNLGFADLHVTKVEIVGPDRFDFQLTEGTGPFDIPVGDARVGMKLRFEPTTDGDKLAFIRAESNSPRKVDSIALVGRAKIGPLLRLKTNNLTVDFHDRVEKVLVDTTLDGFFYNAGSDSLLVTAKFIGKDTNSFPIDFAVLDMPPGATESLTLRFYDSIPGLKEAFLVINHVDYQSLDIYRRDTLRLIGTIVGPSSVPGESVMEAGFGAMPNPTSGDASILVAPATGETGTAYTLTISDAVGREVFRHNDTYASEGARLRLKTEGWPAGVYYMTLQSRKGTRTSTLTIQH